MDSIESVGSDLDLNSVLMKDDVTQDVSRETSVETPVEKPVEGSKIEDKKVDDPDVEMDWEDQPGQKAKIKMSELRGQAKWLKDNQQMIAGTMKIREESQKNPTFGKALSAVISRAYNEKGEFQSKEIDGILSKLEAKQEVLEEKVDEKTDDIKEMESALTELDADSPHAKILQRNIAAQKAMRQQLAVALEQNKKFQERLDGLDKFKTDFVTEKQNEATGKQVKQLSELYDKEVGALTDAVKKDGYKFVDDAEKSDFDRALRDAVSAKSKVIKTDADFVKTIKDEAKLIYDRITKRREAYVADYLRKKNGEQKPEVKKDEVKVDRSFAQMGDLLADGMMTPAAT